MLCSMAGKRAYGLTWAVETNLDIELDLIRCGGYKIHNGKSYGEGLFAHYRNAQSLIWPEEDHHRWSDLILKTFLDERITVVMGAKDSSKTHTAAKFALIDYWAFPNETMILISSTELRGLELRVWGDLKDLFRRGQERFPTLIGKVSESLHGIYTELSSVSDDLVRDIRKGITCVPCVGGGGEWVGIERLVGAKQKRRRLIGDEAQFMRASYLTSMEHMDKGDFKAALLCNPLGMGDPPDKVGEPIGGWGTEPQSEKTETWRNRWGGITINLDGRDSPNNDPPLERYPYLISNKDIARTKERRGEDSMEYWMQVIGKRKPGMMLHRVLTREMCLKFGAFEEVIWSGAPTIKVYAIDAAYGGDRCVAGWAEFGLDNQNRTVLAFAPPVLIPIKVDTDFIPEDQIATFVKAHCEREKIPPENVFFDATGRGSLGTSFARLWSANINPIEFGGNATKRPVTSDFFIRDEVTGIRRLKTCEEHYSKFVTELWYSVRYAVESRQIRRLPEECAQEYSLREWYMVRGDRRELETKLECKKRMGRSPDYADWSSIITEGARRLGFQIQKMSKDEMDEDRKDWLAKELESHHKSLGQRELIYQ